MKRPRSNGVRRPAAMPPGETERGAAVPALALAVAAVGYLVWFLAASPVHLAAASRLLDPAALVAEWLGPAGTPLGVVDRLSVLAMSGIILLAAYGTGGLVIDGLRLSEGATRLERAAFCMAAGLNCLSLLTLLLGLAGWLNAWRLIALVLVALAACGGWLSYRDLPLHWPAIGRATFRTSGLPLAMVLAVFCAFLVVGSLLPPWDFDVREYHLQVPKEWFQQGRIDFLPHNVYGNMPLGAEMHPLLAMAAWPGPNGWFYGALAGKVVMASYTLVAALGLVAAGERLGSRLAGSTAAAIYVAHPWVMHVSVSGLNDGALAANVFLAAYVTWLATTSRSSYLLAGFLAGAAAACKYPGLAFAVAPLALGILVASESKSEAPAKQTGWPRLRFGPVWHGSGSGRGAIGVRLAALALFLAGSLAGGGVWYAKNWLLAGNPVYPLAYNTFGGRTRTPAKDAQWRAAHRVPRDNQGRAYSPAELSRSFKTVALTSDLTSPLVAPLIAAGAVGALAALACRRRRSTQELPMLYVEPIVFCLGAMLLVAAIWWFLSHRLERFVLPLWPFASLACGLAAFGRSDRWWHWSRTLFLTGGLMYCFLACTSPLTGDNRYFVSLEQLRRDGPWPEGTDVRIKPAHQWLNAHAQQGEGVLLVGDAAPFDLQMPAWYNTCFDDCWLCEWTGSTSAAGTSNELHRRNIAYVSVDWGEIARYKSPGNYGYDPRFQPEMIAGLVRQRVLGPPVFVAPGRSAEVYPVAAQGPARERTSVFDQDNLVAWCIVPFDSKKRGPLERAEMLDRLKIKRLAYDWRDEHVGTFDEEIETLKQRGIELTAFWFPATTAGHGRTILDTLKKHAVKTQLWISLGDPAPGKGQDEKVAAAVKTLRPIAEEAGAIGCTVGLYNHGGWFGEPENQIAVLKALDVDNAGLVYNFHHGHSHIDRFKELWPKMQPHLLAVNINGMVKGGEEHGKKILPLGQGDQELPMLRIIEESGWRGPVGILGHRAEMDAEVQLRQNLEGLANLGVVRTRESTTEKRSQ